MHVSVTHFSDLDYTQSRFFPVKRFAFISLIMFYYRKYLFIIKFVCIGLFDKENSVYLNN